MKTTELGKEVKLGNLLFAAMISVLSTSVVAVENIPEGDTITVVGVGVEFGVMPYELAYLVTNGARYTFTGRDLYNVGGWDLASECKIAWDRLKRGKCQDAELMGANFLGWYSVIGNIMRDQQCGNEAYIWADDSRNALAYGNDANIFGNEHANMWLAAEIGAVCPASFSGMVASSIQRYEGALDDIGNHVSECANAYFDAKEKGCVRSVPDILSTP